MDDRRVKEKDRRELTAGNPSKYWANKFLKLQKQQRNLLVELDRQRRSNNGSANSPGTAGAPGRSTHVSELTAQALTGVSITPDDGLNTFQGRLLAILSRSSEGPEVEFILTASFDSKTAGRLSGGVSGLLGKIVTEGVPCSLMIQIEELPTT